MREDMGLEEMNYQEKIDEEIECQEENEIEKERMKKEKQNGKVNDNKEEIFHFKQDEESKNIVNQYRIIFNHGIYAGDHANFEQIEIDGGKSKKQNMTESSIFTDEGWMSRWINENYETYSVALIIACAVFDCLPYDWIVEAADKLYFSFHTKGVQEKPRNISMHLLKEFGAEVVTGEVNTYTGKVKVDIIRLMEEQYQEKILKHIWRECPQLRDKIVLWLKKYCIGNRISMAKRAMKIMGSLAYWDYFYFLNSMIKMFLYHKDILSDMVIAQVVVALNEHEEYRKNINNLMRKWNKENNVHCRLTNFFICAELRDKCDILEEAISVYIDGLKRELSEGKQKDYSKNICEFFLSGMRAYTFYRIMIEKIYDLAYDTDTLSEKEEICQLFLMLFAVDVDVMETDQKEDALFIKLCFVDDCNYNIKYKIADLWRLVWNCRSCRQIFLHLMSRYEINMKKYKDNHRLECFVKNVFGDICTTEIQEDICNKIRRRTK